jgi:hypothetical protein
MFHTKPPGFKKTKNVEILPKTHSSFPGRREGTSFSNSFLCAKPLVVLSSFRRPLVARDEGRDAFLLGGWSFPGVPKATRGI